MPGGSKRCQVALTGSVATGVCFCRGLGTRMAVLASAASHLGLRMPSDGESHGTLHGARLVAAKKAANYPPLQACRSLGHKRAGTQPKQH